MVLKAMTDSSNPNRVTREEALKILNEQLTGQKFSEALNESERIIKQINQMYNDSINSVSKKGIYHLLFGVWKEEMIKGNYSTRAIITRKSRVARATTLVGERVSY